MKSRLVHLRLEHVANLFVVVFLSVAKAGLLFAQIVPQSAIDQSAEVIRRADELNLAEDPTWRIQLFYVSRVLRTDTSIVDSSNSSRQFKHLS